MSKKDYKPADFPSKEECKKALTECISSVFNEGTYDFEEGYRACYSLLSVLILSCRTMIHMHHTFYLMVFVL